MRKCEYCKEVAIGSKRSGDDVEFLCAKHFDTVYGRYPQLFEPSTEG